MHAQLHVRGDDGRADVQRRAGRGRDPVLFDFQQFKQPVEDDFFVDERDAHALGGAVHALEVLLGAEHADFALIVLERLQPLEDALRIVEHRRGEVERDRAVRLDDRFFPLAVLILHRQHIVGEDLAEPELALVDGFFFQFFRFDEFHKITPLWIPRTPRGFFLFLSLLLYHCRNSL